MFICFVLLNVLLFCHCRSLSEANQTSCRPEQAEGCSSMLCVIGLTCSGRDQATHVGNKTFSSCWERIFSMFCSQPAFHGILCLSVLALRLCLIQNAENKTELVPESIRSRNSEGWMTLTAPPSPLLLPLFHFCFVFCCCSMALLQLPATPTVEQVWCKTPVLFVVQTNKRPGSVSWWGGVEGRDREDAEDGGGN